MSLPAFTPAVDQRFRSTAHLIGRVMEIDQQFLLQGDPKSPTLPWMPFQAADFLAMMFDVTEAAAGRQFLDVGCGPGTKLALAQHFFGYESYGVEINPKMAAYAEKEFPDRVVCANAAVFPGYGFYDVIWLYRPFRDPAMEAGLEMKIFADMKPGAVLAGGAWEHCPADMGWVTVVDDWELRRGAWRKPVTAALCCGYEPVEPAARQRGRPR